MTYSKGKDWQEKKVNKKVSRSINYVSVIETWVKTKDILLNLLDLYFLRKKTRM
jgi:hypothetical protein